MGKYIKPCAPKRVCLDPKGREAKGTQHHKIAHPSHASTPLLHGIHCICNLRNQLFSISLTLRLHCESGLLLAVNSSYQTLPTQRLLLQIKSLATLIVP